jgi:hypothetical protein
VQLGQHQEENGVRFWLGPTSGIPEFTEFFVMFIKIVEALAVIAKEFAMYDVGRLVPRMVQRGEVQLPQQLRFVSARDGEPVAVFAAALQKNACLLKKRANAPERIIQIR